MTKRASVKQALGVFALGVVAYLGMRWGGYEPYVIPSGSMIPTLLIYDHILVNKHKYGLRWPFTDQWISGPKAPARGEVVVFRSIHDPDFFMVKRVVGLPGEHLTVEADGELLINNTRVPREQVMFAPADRTRVYEERLPGGITHLIQQGSADGIEENFEVPEGHIFLMGDNRDSSQDSRFWGPLPIANLLGKAQWIWLSCVEAVSNQQILCNPTSIRWQRIFSKIQ